MKTKSAAPDLRGDELPRLCALRTEEAQVSGAIPAAATRHPEPRPIPLRAQEPRPEALQRGGPGLGGEHRLLKGCLVSIDAAGCQKKHVRKIVERGGDHVISLKGNQSTMHEEIRAFMLNPAFNKSFASARTVDCSRGKVVTRTCWQTAEIDWFEDRAAWKGLRSACMVKSEAYDKKTGETTAETRFFISSLPVDPARALKAIRSHWAIEAMHWVLDMEFDEDRSRARSGHSAENLAMLRHVALNVLRLDRSVFGGINRKRKELTWDEEELYQVMVSA